MNFRISRSLALFLFLQIAQISLMSHISWISNSAQAACDPIGAQVEFERLYASSSQLTDNPMHAKNFSKDKHTEQYVGRNFSKNAITCYLKHTIPTTPLTHDQALVIRQSLTTLVLEVFRNGIERTRILKQVINDDILENADPSARFLAHYLLRTTFFIFLHWNSNGKYHELFENFRKLETVAGLDFQKEFEAMKISEWLLSDLFYAWKLAISTQNRLSHSLSREASSTRKRFDEKHARLEDMRFVVSSTATFQQILLKGEPFPVLSAIDIAYLPNNLPPEEIAKLFSLVRYKQYWDTLCPNCNSPISFFDLEEKRNPSSGIIYSSQNVSPVRKDILLCPTCENTIAFDESSSSQASAKEKAPTESELKRPKQEPQIETGSDFAPIFPIFSAPADEVFDVEMPGELPDALPVEFLEFL